VQVAADLCLLDQRRRLATERLLAQLGWAPRDAERTVDRRLVGGCRQRLERVDVRRGAGRPQERGAESLRRRHDELDRDALDRDPDGPVVLAVDHRNDLRQRGEACGGVGRADHGEPFAGIAPATDVAGRRAVDGRRDAVDQVARAVEQQPARRLRRGPAGQRLEQPSLGLGPDAGDAPQPPRRRGLAQFLRRPDPERARDVDRAPRGQPEVAAEADEAGRQLALELGQLGDVAGLDQLAQPRLDARPDPPQPPDLPGPHEVRDRDRRRADRLRRPAVRARGVRVRLGELEQRRERLEPVGDAGVVHDGSVPGSAIAFPDGNVACHLHGRALDPRAGRARRAPASARRQAAGRRPRVPALAPEPAVQLRRARGRAAVTRDRVPALPRARRPSHAAA
jgi:hypothetical protein